MRVSPGFRFEEAVTVKRIIIVSTFLIIAALLALGLSTAHGGTLPGWSSDLDKSIARARADNRPMVVVFASSTCDSCAQFEQILSKVSASKALKLPVKVRLELSKNEDVANRYSVKETPTTLLFLPDTGFSTPVFSHTGVLSMKELQTLSRTWAKR